ncbi:hypothetical protein C8Q80DRAFT_471684 [Daedaleopsis nitida]|nr:hypothetical protein C8Q80DRAFT_471684 [Daedaleopsis nitida]
MYLWKKRIKSFQLLDSQSKRPVAESHSASHGIFSRRRPMGITMGPELIPFLDAVILSFIVCEKERRDSESGPDGGDSGDSGDGGGGDGGGGA